MSDAYWERRRRRGLFGGIILYWITQVLYYQMVFYGEQNGVTGKDLLIYLNAGAAYLRGEPVYWFSRAGYGDNFIYPPHTLPVFAWLSQLPENVVIALWISLTTACLWAVLALILRRAFHLPAVQALVLPVLALGLIPASESLRLGQVDALILLAILGFIYGYKHPSRLMRYGTEAAFATLASIKFTPLILLAIPFFQGEYRKVLRVLAMVAAMFAISIITQGTTIWMEYLDTFRFITGSVVYGGSAISITSLVVQTGKLASLTPSVLSTFLLDALTVGLTAAGFLVIVLKFRHDRERATALFLMGTVFMITVSKLAWHYHLIYLIPATVYFLGHSWRGEGKPDNFILVGLLMIHCSTDIVTLFSWQGFAVVGYYLLLARFYHYVWRWGTKQPQPSQARIKNRSVGADCPVFDWCSGR